MMETSGISGQTKVAPSSSPLIKAALSVGAALLVAVVFLLVARHQRADAVSITTVSVSNGQIGTPYSFQLNGSDSGGNTGTVTWSDDSRLAAIGLRVTASGQIVGTCTQVVRNMAFTVFAVAPGEVATSQTYTITVYGRLSFQMGPPAIDTSTRLVAPGSSNVTMCTFSVQAIGEDIRLNSLTFFGIGSGSETFDVQRVKIYKDVNTNWVVDSGDVLITPAGTFSTTQGFNPSVTFGGASPGIGYVVDSHANGGWDTFIVAYDFAGSVESARTFRIAFMAGVNDLSWDAPYTGGVSGVSTISGGTIRTTLLGSSITSYKGANVTIIGPAPSVPTLYMSDGGNIDGNTVAVSSGASNVAALPLTFWADSSHNILIDQIKITDSGSGIPSLQVTTAKLFYDLDRDGKYSASDLQISSDTFTNNTVTFKNLSLLVTTPTANPNDAGALNLLVTYDFSSSVPTLTPPLTFQARITSKTDVVARELVTNGSIFLQDTAIPLAGNILTIVSGTTSTLTVDSGSGGTFGATSVANTAADVAVWRGRFYASSGHRIRLTALRLYATGSLDERYDLSSVRLIKDRDNSGSVTSGDITLFTATTYSADNDSILLSGLNEIIETPTGLKTDSNALNLLLVYNLNGNAPVVKTPDSVVFSASLLNTSDITATRADTVGNVSFITGPPVYGASIRVDTTGATVTVVSSTGGGPTIQNATYVDADTSGAVNAGDYIIVAFDTNLAPTSTGSVVSALPDFILPVTGDGFGTAASVSFVVGNKMKITLGTSASLTITGAYVAGTHGAGSISGINTKDTVSTITSVNGRAANQATTAVDIGGALAAVSTASGPFPTRAQFSDADTTYGLSSGDQVVITFSDNITATAVTKTDFRLLVTGDFFGVSDPTISQTRGDQLTIRFTSQPTLTIAGSFVATNLGAGNPSGINLSGIVNAIKDSQGRSGVPAAAALDIEGLDTGTSDSAPRPVSATYWDKDSSGAVNAGDFLDIAFDKNIVLTGAVPVNKLLLPKLGDIITNGTISQFGGNKLRVTLGAGDTFRVSGVFQSTALYETASSGINLLSTISTIQDLQGRSAIPATVAVDIAGGDASSTINDTFTATTSTTTTSSSSSGASNRGDAACIIARTPGLNAWADEFRAVREWMMDSAAGRLLAALYYLL